MDKLKVGQFLKHLREQKGKTQNSVALDLVDYGIEVSDKTIAKWEKGNVPDIDKLDAIASYYNIKPSDILNGEIYYRRDWTKKYFIVNDNWMNVCNPNKLFETRVQQEEQIKKRVKELLVSLIKNSSLNISENEELNFLLEKFYCVSDYAIQKDDELETLEGINQIKLLRHLMYTEILSMHGCSVGEIYWEVQKFIIYNKRVTFRNTVCDFENDIHISEKMLKELEDWEKDLLLAQVQTNNITNCYGQTSKLNYLKHFGKDYDEERITKEGIRLLINCGAKLNHALLGYTIHKHFEYSILDRMEQLHKHIFSKILIPKYNNEKGVIEYYWAENCLKNRLIELYYALNCTRMTKIPFDIIYEMFIQNDTIPNSILLDRAGPRLKDNMSEKEQLLFAEQFCPYEIKTWNECKERERLMDDNKHELAELENKWRNGDYFECYEYADWVGEKDYELTESDILYKLSKMDYNQFIASREDLLTKKLLIDLDTLSLDEIRNKYFPVEERYEEL